MKIYALICHKLDLTQFWPKVVSWRFEITTDELWINRGSSRISSYINFILILSGKAELSMASCSYIRQMNNTP